MSDRVECMHPRGGWLVVVSGSVESTHSRGERFEEVSGRVECTHPRGGRLVVVSGSVERARTQEASGSKKCPAA